jgi:hypothetical protein
VLPRPSRCALLARPDAVPGGKPEIRVPGGVLVAFQRFWRDIGLRKVGHGIAARFEEQEHVFTVGDPRSTEAHAHAPPQRLGVQKSLGQRFGHQEPADCSGRERTLLPR